MRTELMIGCGRRRTKDPRLPTWIEIRDGHQFIPGRPGLDFSHLVTLDVNHDHNPDIIFDLTWIGKIEVRSAGSHSYSTYHPWKIPLPNGDATPDNTYDEIHAYEVLEHIGQQGDAKLFFDQFSEFHRILKPDGLLFATCPAWHSLWAWGDPSHTRIINSGSLVFLSQAEYVKQVGETPMSDFRHIYHADFETIFVNEATHSFEFVLRAVK